MIGKMFLFCNDRKFFELVRLGTIRANKNIVPDLMEFKCSPCQAEKEKTAFTGDGDGWMSSIISRGFFRFLIC